MHDEVPKTSSDINFQSWFSCNFDAPTYFEMQEKHEKVDQSCIQFNVTLLYHGICFENPTDIAIMAH